MPTSYIYPSYILHPAIAAADDASTSKGALYILLSGETSVVAGRELCLFIYALRICALRICVFARCASAGDTLLTTALAPPHEIHTAPSAPPAIALDMLDAEASLPVISLTSLPAGAMLPSVVLVVGAGSAATPPCSMAAYNCRSCFRCASAESLHSESFDRTSRLLGSSLAAVNRSRLASAKSFSAMRATALRYRALTLSGSLPRTRVQRSAAEFAS
mmetsp:Transcript_64294/g.143659  ORF Transcript_64294/g.143659 Transcript_64294/m.143659 type:complete len:218 (+) Transcript_64294:540-1193(+)